MARFCPICPVSRKRPFIGLGAGYAALSIWFVLLGAYRQRANEHALAERHFLGLKQSMVAALSVYMTALIVATGWVLLMGSRIEGTNRLPSSSKSTDQIVPAGATLGLTRMNNLGGRG